MAMQLRKSWGKGFLNRNEPEKWRQCSMEGVGRAGRPPPFLLLGRFRSGFSEIELGADLEEPRLRDRQGIEIRALGRQYRRPVGLLIHVDGVGVRQVEDVDRYQGLG